MMMVSMIFQCIIPTNYVKSKWISTPDQVFYLFTLNMLAKYETNCSWVTQLRTFLSFWQVGYSSQHRMDIHPGAFQCVISIPVPAHLWIFILVNRLKQRSHETMETMDHEGPSARYHACDCMCHSNPASCKRSECCVESRIIKGPSLSFSNWLELGFCLDKETHSKFFKLSYDEQTFVSKHPDTRSTTQLQRPLQALDNDVAKWQACTKNSCLPLLDDSGNVQKHKKHKHTNVDM